MPDGLWWLPSLLVFAAATAVLIGGVVALRRGGARRERSALAAGAAAEVRAKGLIVQADNAVRDAERELAFAEAQFGADASRALRGAIDAARAWMREAFILQQRLDDAEADTSAERRNWTARIEGLCTSAIGALDDAESAIAGRRRTERGAQAELPALRAQADRLARRRVEAEAMLGRLATRFAESALVTARGAESRVDAALAAVTASLDEAESNLARSEPAAHLLGAAADELARAGRDLDEIDALELALAKAQADASEEAAALDRELVAARRQRDAQEDADAAEALARRSGRGRPRWRIALRSPETRSPTVIGCARAATGSRWPGPPLATRRAGSTALAVRSAAPSRSPRASCAWRGRRSSAAATPSGPMRALDWPRPSANS